ncbi:MAG: heme transporter permease [Francisellaceae bacterium]|nr:heme transporter permease [Francisellaceae bacterium]
MRLIKPFISPHHYYLLSQKLLPYLIGLFALSLSYGLIGGVYLAPLDYQQGDGFRIIYVHVPAAFLSLFIYVFMGVQSFIYLVWRLKLADVLAKVSASLGAAFTILAIISGALWGKPMWGTWWVWDARLTSELILLFLYIGYIALSHSNHSLRNGTRTSAPALLNVIGLIDIPIIHYSVNWWYTLHQGSTIIKLKPSIHPSMYYPLIAMMIAFFTFYFIILILKSTSLLLINEHQTRWVKNILDKDTLSCNF